MAASGRCDILVAYEILPFLDMQNSPLLPNVCEGDCGNVNCGLPTVVLEV